MGKNETIIDVTVTPKSSRTGIVVVDSNMLKVYLNAPPVDGAANEECIRLFSRSLKVPRSQISIVRGQRGRKKCLRVEGLTKEEIFEKLR